MSSILTALAAADEDYLVVMSNKGLYKRAQRELTEAGVVIKVSGETVTAGFADGTSVTIEGSLQNYTCTCPSRSVCKHLLMAVLAAREEIRALSADEQKPAEADTPVPPDYGAVSEITASKLEKLAGKRAFKNAVLAVQLGEKCVIDETSTLRITLNDSGNTVIFLPDASLDAARCTCKSEGFCAHKAQAAVQYINFKKGSLPEDFPLSEEESPLEFSTYTLPYIRQFIIEILDAGLVRLPEDTRGRFLQLATLCHSRRLANMERLCNRIAGRLEHFAARSATFDRDLLITDLCRLLYSCKAIEAGNGGKEIVGVFREAYRPVPQLELWGLGAWGWQSAGGYRGVTVSFFCPETAEAYTFTSALPLDLVPNIDKLYAASAPWGLQEKLSGLSRTRLTLKGGKVSGKGQLSASDESAAAFIGATDIASPELGPLRFDDFELLLEALWQRGESGGDGFMTAILIPERAEASCYDKIAQRWSLTLRDKAERGLTLSVRYEQSAALLISNLQHFESLDRLCQPMLARVSLEGGELNAYPVTLYGQEYFNLSLDKPEASKNGRKALFDWGDA